MNISNFSRILPAIALSLMAGAAASQTLTPREPGLWEIRIDKGSQMANAMKGMADMLQNIPAAQRKQMEQMMKDSGVSLSNPTVIKQCVTPEMAARGFEPQMDDADMKCTSKMKDVSKTESQFSFSCQGPEGKLEGEGRVLDATAKSYKTEMKMSGDIEGQPVSMDMAHEGRWLGKDCQGIKPLG
ncbi:DUF3617 domain-containing protein [Alcaligenaceae bacterium CGII-47]|nr:DUF3617 domain-containing protein [Alcaligenaceae bacterium CGII-47]